MKTLMTTVFILLLITVQSQKKKDLMSEVHKYRYGVIMNATYAVEQDELEDEIEDYLTKYGYDKSTNPDDGLLFRISYGGGYLISEYPPKDQAPVKEEGEKIETEEPLLKTKKQKYKSVYYTTIRELILEVNGQENLSLTLNKNSFPTPGKDSKIHRGYFTINKMYYELKKHLYILYNEDFVKLPEDLMARVNTFNDTKKSQRGKIDLHDF